MNPTFKKIFVSIALMLGIVLAISCQSTQPTKLPQLHPTIDIKIGVGHINNTQKGLETAANTITTQTGVIRTAFNNIERKLPQTVLPAVAPEIKQGRESTELIDKQVLEIKRLSGLLEQAKAALSIAADKVDTLESQVTLLTKERDQAFAERDKALEKEKDATQKMLRWLIVLCVIGGGAGIALMVTGNMATGSIIALGSGTTLVLAIAVNAYFHWIAIGGLVLLAGCVGVLVWQLFIRNKALQEVVHTTEIAKRRLPPAARKKIFGFQSEPGDAYSIQSTTTENMVAKIRRKFKPQWEHTIKDDPTLTLVAQADMAERASN